MLTARNLRAPLHWTVAGLSVLDIAVALILSAGLAAGIVGALPFSTDHGSAAAAAGALLMTLPLAWRRRAPLATAAVLAAGALLNGLIFGPMVRCGAALPAVYMVAFTVGTIRDRARSAAGLALCAAAVVAEGLYDPQIEAQGLPFVLVAAGRVLRGRLLVRARTRTAEALRQRSAELRDQREQTARLAVLADRAKMSADLEGALHAQIGGIAAAAAAGLGALAAEDDGPAAATGDAAARQALASIEHDGRAVLDHLREVLGALREPAPSEPQPTLAQHVQAARPGHHRRRPPHRGREPAHPAGRAGAVRLPDRGAPPAGPGGRAGRGRRRAPPLRPGCPGTARLRAARHPAPTRGPCWRPRGNAPACTAAPWIAGRLAESATPRPGFPSSALMPDLTGLLKRLLTSWRGDALVGRAPGGLGNWLPGPGGGARERAVGDVARSRCPLPPRSPSGAGGRWPPRRWPALCCWPPSHWGWPACSTARLALRC